MTVGVHDFEIPHDMVSPCRDIIIVKLPRPPEKIGAIHVPGMTRDLAQHNTMAGVIAEMGALAFAEKHGETELRKVRVYINRAKTIWRDPQVGDWAVFRPFAGTMMQGGQLVASSGYRYMSSFNDVLGVIAPEFMPDVATLLWDDKDADQAEMKFPASTKADFNFDSKKA